MQGPLKVAPADGPFDGVTQIRIHGVGGATPEKLLQDSAPRQVSGDRVAGFYRTSGTTDPGSSHLEAYAWGGLTSRSRTRVLWLMLLPFMLANMAGWMAEPTADRKAGDPPTSAWFRWVVRAVAVAVTVAAMLMFCLLGMDVIGYQCGGQDACVQSGWWLDPLAWSWVAGYPARRLLFGALLPLLLLVLLGYLSYSSRARYEQVEPPLRSGSVAADRPAPRAPKTPAQPTAAARPRGLEDASFWSGRDSHARLSRLHLAAGVAVVSLILQHCVVAAFAAVRVPPAVPLLGNLAAAVQIGVCLSVLVLLTDRKPKQLTSVVVLIAAAGALLLTGLFAFLQPLAPTPAGQMAPGMRWGIIIGWVFVAGSHLLLLLTLAWHWFRRSRALDTRPQPTRPASLKSFDGWPDTAFRWGAPFVLPVVGLLLFHGIFLSVLVWVVDVLLDGAGNGTAVALALPPMVRAVLSYMIFFGVAILIIYLLWIFGRWMLQGTRRQTQAFLDAVTRVAASGDDDAGDYPPQDHADVPKSVRDWLVPASAEEFPARHYGRLSAILQGRSTEALPLAPTKWARRRSRWNFLAGAPRTINYLLTGLVAGAVLIAIIVWTQFLAYGTNTQGFWVKAASTIGILIPPTVIGFMALTWRQPDRRRVVGTIWDVGTFWPRSFHPFAPPCYSERAVPELIRRVWWLHDNGGRVVLVAHSQGSVIAAAAALRESPRDVDPCIGIVTFGSPLRKLYQWAFPSYLPASLFDSLAAGQGGLGPVCWTNVYYPTDYIGGPVGAATEIDVRLCDPATDAHVYGQPAPKVVTHTGYWEDRRLWNTVDEVSDRASAHASGQPVLERQQIGL